MTKRASDDGLPMFANNQLLINWQICHTKLSQRDPQLRDVTWQPASRSNVYRYRLSTLIETIPDHFVSPVCVIYITNKREEYLTISTCQCLMGALRKSIQSLCVYRAFRNAWRLFSGVVGMYKISQNMAIINSKIFCYLQTHHFVCLG